MTTPHSPKMARISNQLREGKIPNPPQQAPWSPPCDEGLSHTFTVYNFKRGRFEYFTGRIPAQYLDDYSPQKRG